MSSSDRPPERDRADANAANPAHRGEHASAYSYEIAQQRLREETHTREYQRLRFEQDRLDKARRRATASYLIRTIAYLLAALQVLLGLRFFLRLTAANAENAFASVIYGLSNPFVAPFSTLFVSPTLGGNAHIFDVNLLTAMLAYMVLGLLAIWLVRVLFSR